MDRKKLQNKARFLMIIWRNGHWNPLLAQVCYYSTFLFKEPNQ